MADSPSADAATRVRHAVENSDIVITIEQTPAGRKVAYQSDPNPFAITSDQFDAFRTYLDEYEDLIVTVYQHAQQEEDSLQRAWAIGNAIDAHEENTDEIDYATLATVTPSIDWGPKKFTYAVCLSRTFSDPTVLPDTPDRNALHRAGETCLRGESKDAIVDAVTESPGTS